MSANQTGLNGLFNNPVGGSNRLPLEPLDAPQPPPGPLGLTLTPFAEVKEFDESEPLRVKKFHGLGMLFTPHTALTLQCQGITQKSADGFKESYHLLAGGLTQHPLLQELAQAIAFTPVFDWQTRATALMVHRLTAHGLHVLRRLQTITAANPNVKAFTRWVPNQQQHKVGHLPLTRAEEETMARVKWPDREAMLEALTPLAVGTLEELRRLSPEVAVMLSSQEG